MSALLAAVDVPLAFLFGAVLAAGAVAGWVARGLVHHKDDNDQHQPNKGD